MHFLQSVKNVTDINRYQSVVFDKRFQFNSRQYFPANKTRKKTIPL